MKLLSALLVFALSARAFAWETAQPGLKYEFPRDHLVHPAFKTEWWYFTGNLKSDEGRSFGFQVTFFRQGVNEKPGESHFAVRDLAFAHAAISDLGAGKFYFSQEVSRMNFGEAGFGGIDRVAWIKSWALKWLPGEEWKFSASPQGQMIDLRARSTKPAVIHGLDGISQKAAGAGHASYYYSQTRLAVSGTLKIEGIVFKVSGLAWFDHEWATNQLAADQIGWNWLGLHLADGRDLMLYQMRRKDGRIDPASSGTLVDAQGRARHLMEKDFSLLPSSKKWRSPATGAEYPSIWEIQIPSEKLRLTARAALENQEMNLAPVVYWEGATLLDNAAGEGYMELTGYGEALQVLRGQ